MKLTFGRNLPYNSIRRKYPSFRTFLQSPVRHFVLKRNTLYFTNKIIHLLFAKNCACYYFEKVRLFSRLDLASRQHDMHIKLCISKFKHARYLVRNVARRSVTLQWILPVDMQKRAWMNFSSR